MANLPSAQAPRVSYALYFRDCRAEFSINLDSSEGDYVLHVWLRPCLRNPGALQWVPRTRTNLARHGRNKSGPTAECLQCGRCSMNLRGNFRAPDMVCR